MAAKYLAEHTHTDPQNYIAAICLAKRTRNDPQSTIERGLPLYLNIYQDCAFITKDVKA